MVSRSPVTDHTVFFLSDLVREDRRKSVARFFCIDGLAGRAELLVPGRTLGTTGALGCASWISERLPTRMKSSSRAAWRALIASFTRERGTKLPKNDSTSCWSAAMTQSRYFESSAESASPTDRPMPSRTASGAQR